jgi:hemerythrin superfamily protein
LAEREHGYRLAMDAITLLKNDHQHVERLFRQYEQAGDRAYVKKRDLVDRIIEELSRHAAIEEQLFYPAARETVPGTEELTLESVEEHHVMKWELSELESMDPHDERFDAKVRVLIETVRHHVDEEESDFFPMVRSELGRNELNELGDAMEDAKATAPTHPHPRSPQRPPLNRLVGLVAGAVDAVVDTARGVAQGSVTAVKDVVGRVSGRPSRQPAPTGSSRARDTAAQVRGAVAETIDRAGEGADRATEAADDVAATARRTAQAAGTGAARTARSAVKGAASTTRTARSGAKATATSAGKGARRTATTAKRASTSTRRSATTAARSTKRTASAAASSASTAARR